MQGRHYSKRIAIWLPVRGERGIALVMVLVLSLVALALMSALIYIITAGTQISGAGKQYKTAQEAASGGADITFQLIAARGNPNIPLPLFSIPALNVGGVDCLAAKLNQPTSAWNAACNSTLSIDPNDQTTYDITFQLGGGGNTYAVYSKIVDTVEGNSGGDLGLSKGGVVSGTNEITVMSIPYFYTVEIDAQNSANSNERAKYSILYEY